MLLLEYFGFQWYHIFSLYPVWCLIWMSTVLRNKKSSLLWVSGRSLHDNRFSLLFLNSWLLMLASIMSYHGSTWQRKKLGYGSRSAWQHRIHRICGPATMMDPRESGGSLKTVSWSSKSLRSWMGDWDVNKSTLNHMFNAGIGMCAPGSRGT